MKILICVDGSPKSMGAVVKAVEIASGCNVSEVTILGVHKEIPLLYLPEESNSDDLKNVIGKNKKLNDWTRMRHQKYLEHAAIRFKEKGIEPNIIMKDGHPAQIITEVAQDGDYDMIIMGGTGQSNLKNRLLGSVSHSVMQESKKSVLVVK